MLAQVEHALGQAYPASHACKSITHFNHGARPQRQGARSLAKRRKLGPIVRAADSEQPDLIERIVGRLFGKQALEDRSPGGMQRMSDEALLEQYPATLTEFADPVESDDNEMAIFRPLLAQTRLQKLPLRHVCCYL